MLTPNVNCPSRTDHRWYHVVLPNISGNVLLPFIEVLRPPMEIVDTCDADVNDNIVFLDCHPTGGNHLLENMATEATAVFDQIARRIITVQPYG